MPIWLPLTCEGSSSSHFCDKFCDNRASDPTPIDGRYTRIPPSDSDSGASSPPALSGRRERESSFRRTARKSASQAGRRRPVTGRLCPVHNEGEALAKWLFLAGAVVFVVASIRAGDLLFTVGSVLVLAACVVFLAGRGRPTRDR